MIVYCDVYDCKHNEDGKCANKWPVETEAIKISDNWMGLPTCSDVEYEEDET